MCCLCAAAPTAGVWKDAKLSRYIPGGWQQQAKFVIEYIDGSFVHNSLSTLHSWIPIDPLEQQLPLIPAVYWVDEARLRALPG
jgi:hypothetical protein|eukprot:COSAG01_NODE_38038_length_495_cov_0.916667_1_plen_83_part_00